MTVTRLDGHGTITLPRDYVRQHLQLAYATTEPGAQGDTSERSLTLATNATTRRGLYMAMTRGQRENLALVVTNTHDLAEARAVLEAVLFSDRADIPATVQRRNLAATVPASVPQRRVRIPDWFDQIRDEAEEGWRDRTATARRTQHRARRRPRASCVGPPGAAGGAGGTRAVRRAGRHRRTHREPSTVGTTPVPKVNCGVPVEYIADRLAATSRLPATSSPSRPIDSTGPRSSRHRHGAGSTSSTTSSTITAAWTRPGGCSTNSTTSKASPKTPGASATPSTNGSTGPTAATSTTPALVEIAATFADHDDRPGINQLAAPLTQWAQRRGLELQPPTLSTPTRSSIGIEIDF